MSSRFFSQGHTYKNIKCSLWIQQMGPAEQSSKQKRLNPQTRMKLASKNPDGGLVAVELKPRKEEKLCWNVSFLSFFLFGVAGMLMWWPLCAVVKRLRGCGTNQEEVSAFLGVKERDILKITGDSWAFQCKNTDYVQDPCCSCLSDTYR